MSTSYGWEGKGRYGSFRLRTCGCAGKTAIPYEHAPYLSVSEVVNHYEEVLYQVYAPLPLPLLSLVNWRLTNASDWLVDRLIDLMHQIMVHD